MKEKNKVKIKILYTNIYSKMDLLYEAALLDIESTQLEKKVADRTKNELLIYNTQIDIDTAKEKADAVQSLISIIQPLLSGADKDTMKKIKQQSTLYKKAAQTKYNAAKELDEQTEVVSILVSLSLGKKRRSRRKTTYNLRR